MNKNLLIVLTILLTAVFISPTTFAINQKEASSSPSQKFGLTFPIPELGNCNNVSECKAYCEDKINHDACKSFAQKKGFYKSESKKTDIITSAKQYLGCDSEEACKQFCGQQENWVKCGEFAKKFNLKKTETTKPKPSPNSELLQKAKELLGCTSESACKTFCAQDKNKQLCQDFANKIGLKPQSKNPQSDSCRAIKEKISSSSAIPDSIKIFYQKNCLKNDNGLLHSTTSGKLNSQEEICRLYPDKCRTQRPEENFLKPPSTATQPAVRGISTPENLLQKILRMIGGYSVNKL